MNTIEKLLGAKGCVLVVGDTKVVFPTGYAAYAIIVNFDTTEIAEVEQIVAGAVAVVDDASWMDVELTRGDYIPLEIPISSITLNAATDSVFCYFEPTTYVEAPTDFTATPDSGVTIDLDWTNNTNDDGIVIERSLDEITWVVAATIAKDPSPVDTYADEDLEEETKYFYRARAFNGVYFSEYTATDSDTTETI